MGCGFSIACCHGTCGCDAHCGTAKAIQPELVGASRCSQDVSKPSGAPPSLVPQDVKVKPKSNVVPAATAVAIKPKPAAAAPTGTGGLIPAVHTAFKTLSLIHFNDVYNIESRTQEPVGGASKFVTKIKQLTKDQNSMILFAGDAFSPSIMSTLTKGEQMPPILNNIGVDVCAVGNHDLDFGVERMEELISQCKCPWLMANVLTKDTGQPFKQCLPYVIKEWEGIKVGIMGLVEYEWLATLATLSVDDVKYIDFVEEGHRLVKVLKDAGCEVIIALTHMRVPNDLRLGQEVPGIDIILGGHDHHYEVTKCEPNETLMFKSGTDFRELSLIEMKIPSVGKPTVTHERILITSEIPDDPGTSQIVDKYMAMVAEKMEGPLGYTASPLDGRFGIVRTQESNLGNLITDIVRLAMGTDLVMINSGTLRSDAIHEGTLKNRDLVSILPMMDEMCIIEITGEQVLESLENAVCMYPKMEGRFLQVSGLTFEFDPSLVRGSRVIRTTATIGGQPLDLTKSYTLFTKEYLAEGKDGFGVFKDCKLLQDAEDSPHLPTMVTNHFDAIRGLNEYVASGDNLASVADANQLKLIALAEAADQSDKSAVIRWVEGQAEYVVDPCIEGRIICIQ